MSFCRVRWLVVFLAAFVVAPRAFSDWPALYDSLKVRTLHLEMEQGSSWSAVVSDSDFNNPQKALLWMEGEAPVPVEVKRKSDPAVGQKVSVKIDITARNPGAEWHGVEKLSLENGAAGGLVKEGFGWQMHRLASEAGIYSYPSAYAAWVRLIVDGQLIGVYTSVEERDDQMLKNRGMWKAGATWLYKNDPTPALEEGTGDSPTFMHLCFSPFKDRNPCSQPASLEADLQTWIDMQGMLTLGAIEAFTGNRDGLFTHNGKNHFFADYAPPLELKRIYFPWDLDTGISDVSSPILGWAGAYQSQVLGHPWFRQWFLHLMADLLDGPLSTESLTQLLNELEPVVTPALLEDPNDSVGGDPAGHFASLREWVTNRIANVRVQMGQVIAPVRFSPPAGEIVPGFELSLQHTNAAGTIYFTTNGTDPRAVGGEVAGMEYTQPLVLSNTTCLTARVRSGTNWSALRRGVFNVANHASAIKVTEIMYQAKPPLANQDAGQYEFIELQNRSPTAVNLSGCVFDGIDFAFRPGTIVQPSNFVVLVRNAVAFTNRYPGVAYHGIYWGGLDQDGEKVRLKNSDGNNIFSVEYNDAPPWPLGPNGFGWSLVNIKPEGDPDDASNWRASGDVNGSPGVADRDPPYGVGVVINEVLTHTDPPVEDAIELHNPTASAINIGGWWLSDQIENQTPELLKKFVIPAGTFIQPRGYKVFYEHEFNSGGFTSFALSSLGDQVYLTSGDAFGDLSGYITGVEFGASDNGVSFQRLATTDGADVTVSESVTLGRSNSPPRVGPIVINEIMFHPTNGGHEFLEFYNLSTNAVDLSGWSVQGANYVFANETTIAASGFLVLGGSTNLSAAEFRSRYGVPALVPVLMHDFDLGNAAEAIALLKPNDSPTNAFILVDRVRYNDQGLWPHEADGNGPSLERLSASAYGNEPRNWRTTLAGGSPGRRNEFDRITAIARGSKWKINSLGRNLGQAWRGTNYSDSGWASGDAPIGSGYLSLRSSLTNRPVTTYFRKAFVVFDEQAQTTNFILSVNYDDGFVAYLNGHEVARRGLAAGEASFSSFASDHAGGAYENVDLTAFRGWIHQGVNTLAIEVHQSSVSDHDLVWDAELSYVRVDQSAPRPAFTVITLKNSTEALLRWTSVSGRAYRLYASGNLQSWIPLEPAITATNNLTQIIVTRTNAASQFFRVSLEP